MNPFLDPTRAEPAPGSFRLRGARRCAGRMALAAGLGLGALHGARAVDVNTANQGQLEALRGIGPKTAATIVDERRRGGPFHSFDDLAERVRGLGSKRLERLRAAGLTLGREPAAAAQAPAPAVMINVPGNARRK